MTKWSNPVCATRILIKLLLSMTYILIVFLMWISPLVHDAIHIMDNAGYYVLYCGVRQKGSNYLLFKKADTAFWL